MPACVALQHGFEQFLDMPLQQSNIEQQRNERYCDVQHALTCSLHARRELVTSKTLTLWQASKAALNACHSKLQAHCIFCVNPNVSRTSGNEGSLRCVCPLRVYKGHTCDMARLGTACLGVSAVGAKQAPSRKSFLLAQNASVLVVHCAMYESSGPIACMPSRPCAPSG